MDYLDRYDIPLELSDHCDTLFLDRDGVINVWLPGDYVKNWSEFRFCEGFLEAIRRWNGQFRHIFIVSNQRGVGKGLMTLQDMEEIHRLMLEFIVQAGGRIDRIYTCTAISDDDPMRKPNPGMALQARKEFPEVEMSHSLMIGDQESDRQFAMNCGMKFFKV